ncbi:MAG: hypothetical protein L6V88_07020 [Anaerotruncus sp.]|nr:MAG: hypothetical protein L6V88_07020 [Anaerotruncus sp.]
MWQFGGITSCVSPNTDERDRFVQWARTIGSCVYGALGTLIPMALEMIANATGSSMALMTLVFALIFGFGGAMLSLRCYGAQERVRVVKEKAAGFPRRKLFRCCLKKQNVDAF